MTFTATASWASLVLLTNSFRTTLTPNPEKFYKYHSAMKREETCF